MVSMCVCDSLGCRVAERLQRLRSEASTKWLFLALVSFGPMALSARLPPLLLLLLLAVEQVASLQILSSRSPLSCAPRHVTRRSTIMAALPPETVVLAAEEAVSAVQTFEPRGVTAQDTVVFVLGCAPFLWATVEFWRRIAVGESFGTGQDSVIINDTSGGRKNPVRRVLGQDAIIAARILFALAFASGVLVLIAFFDVTTTGA